jgi:hypothetical protein
MNNRDRETWERFAAAVVCGIYADPTAGALRDEWLVKEAERFLAITKERWPEPEPAKRCEAEASSREGVKTEPDPGEGYRWVRCGEALQDGDEYQESRNKWYRTTSAGKTCPWDCNYRRRIDAAPETTPRADEVRSEVRIAEGDGVEGLPTVGWWKGELVSRDAAEHRIAAARREAQELREENKYLRKWQMPVKNDAPPAEQEKSPGDSTCLHQQTIGRLMLELAKVKAECERLRATDAEIQALRDTEAEWRYRVVQRLCHRGGAVAVADALRGLRERHTNGGAA